MEETTLSIEEVMNTIKKVGRDNWFVIWIIGYLLILWMLYGFMFKTGVWEGLITSFLMGTVLLSNILGLVLVGLTCYEDFPDIWLYFFDNGQWLLRHGHGIGTPGFSFEIIFWYHVLSVVLAFVIVLHLYLCAKRCKDAGISVWWILVPLYNPFVLLLKKRSR